MTSRTRNFNWGVIFLSAWTGLILYFSLSSRPPREASVAKNPQPSEDIRKQKEKLEKERERIRREATEEAEARSQKLREEELRLREKRELEEVRKQAESLRKSIAAIKEEAIEEQRRALAAQRERRRAEEEAAEERKRSLAEQREKRQWEERQQQQEEKARMEEEKQREKAEAEEEEEQDVAASNVRRGSEPEMEIDSPAVCNSSSTFLLVIVLSTEDDFEARNAVRDTWQTHHQQKRRSRIRVLHHVRQDQVMSKEMVESRYLSLRLEQRFKKDLFYAPGVPLTLEQHAAMALAWPLRHCKHVPFVLKVASVRTFVNEIGLLSRLEQEKHKKRLVIGDFHERDPGTMKPPSHIAVVLSMTLLHNYFRHNPYPTEEQLKQGLARRPKENIVFRKMRRMPNVKAVHLPGLVLRMSLNADDLDCKLMQSFFTVSGVESEMMDTLTHQAVACYV